MPPLLAALLTTAFIVYMFRRDNRVHQRSSKALWLPLLWMIISGSRQVSEWLNTFGIKAGAKALEEGSPIDRTVYLILIAAGLYDLSKRRVQLTRLISANRWLAAFLLYCALSVLWSDFPLVALKRWIKVIGHPVMALIILTDPAPVQALTVVLKRCTYVLIPISILFIKYFPEYGRTFSEWTGAALNTGITTNKNLLGVDCLIVGFFFTWYTFQIWKLPKSRFRRQELLVCALFLWTVYYLLGLADSKTPLTALFLALGILLFCGASFVNRKAIGAYVLLIALAVVCMEYFFGVYELALKLLGREATLTERTFLWENLLKVPINPILGAGFESFWLGDRLLTLWKEHPWRPNQAHNGYLETYLNLGYCGLFLLFALLIATWRKAQRLILTNFELGRFRLAFLSAAILYNWTEAGFKTTHFVFFAFYIVAIDYPMPSPRSHRPVNGSSFSDRNRVAPSEPVLARS